MIIPQGGSSQRAHVTGISLLARPRAPPQVPSIVLNVTFKMLASAPQQTGRGLGLPWPSTSTMKP